MIKITGEKEIRKYKPDYMLVLPWPDLGHVCVVPTQEDVVDCVELFVPVSIIL